MTRRRSLAVALLLTAVGVSWARSLCCKVGQWQVTYDTKQQSLTYQHAGRTILSGAVAEASCRQGDATQLLRSCDFERVTRLSHEPAGFLFSRKDRRGAMSLELEAEGEALLVRLSLTSDAQLSSNYLAPILTDTPMRRGGSDSRMLKVPFDNDDFVRYHYCRLDTTMLSYEVTTIFDGAGGRGIVLGSVDHDHWKSGIEVTAAGGNTVTHLKAYSGVSTRETRDVLPHGARSGTKVSSATFLLVDADDWRDGMERFAAVCNQRQPGRQTWQGGTPFGWQSWGVMAAKNNIDVDMAVADFYAGTLRQGGFAGRGGMQIMSIDSWDNLSDAQRRLLTAHCAEQGQMVGIYRSPFSLWWGEDSNLDAKLFDGTDYSARDCILTADGKPIRYDGAFCLDPTHPAVKERMRREMEEARQQGFRYVKVDFICDGIIQADRYHNPEVTTAVEAYNEGMAYFASQCYCADGTPMFIALSIAPIFPYQYANSRRIACDTWGHIGHSEYAMNAILGGWWTNGFYQRNDPDHIVLVGNDSVKETEGENRARLTTGIASGMLLLADNYDTNDHQTGCGQPELSVQRAALLLSNEEINDLARRVSHSFRPVFGNRPYDGQPQSAGNYALYRDGDATYVAIVNYRASALTGVLPLEALGIDGASDIHELWTGQDVTASPTLPFEVPGCDARIYKVVKR